MSILDYVPNILKGTGGPSAMGGALRRHLDAGKEMVTRTPGVLKGIGKFSLAVTSGVGFVFKYIANAGAHLLSFPLKVSEYYLNSSNPIVNILGGGKVGKVLVALGIGVASLFGIHKLMGTFGEKSQAQTGLDREEAMSQLIEATAQSRMLDQQAQRLMAGSGYDRMGSWANSVAGGPRQGTFAEQEAARAAAQVPATPYK